MGCRRSGANRAAWQRQVFSRARPLKPVVRRLTVKMMVHAAWIRAGNELDQPLEVGLEAEFVLLAGRSQITLTARIVLSSTTLCGMRKMRIWHRRVLTIRHPELGDIRRSTLADWITQ